MQIRFQDSFWEDYKKLPKSIQKKVDKAVRIFPENRRHPSFASHKIKGTKNPTILECYLGKKYRFTFHYEGDFIVFRRVGDHSIIKIESRS